MSVETERMIITPTDLDISIVGEVIKTCKNYFLKSCGYVNASLDEFKAYYEETLKAVIQKAVEEFYSDVLDDFEFENSAEEWYGMYSNFC